MKFYSLLNFFYEDLNKPKVNLNKSELTKNPVLYAFYATVACYLMETNDIFDTTRLKLMYPLLTSTEISNALNVADTTVRGRLARDMRGLKELELTLAIVTENTPDEELLALTNKYLAKYKETVGGTEAKNLLVVNMSAFTEASIDISPDSFDAKMALLSKLSYKTAYTVVDILGNDIMGYFKYLINTPRLLLSDADKENKDKVMLILR